MRHRCPASARNGGRRPASRSSPFRRSTRSCNPTTTTIISTTGPCVAWRRATPARAGSCRSVSARSCNGAGVHEITELDWWQEAPLGSIVDRVHAGTALQRPHALDPEPDTVVRLERGDRSPATLLRRRHRVPPGIRAGGRAIRTVRRGPAADRRLRAALVHAAGPHDPRRGRGGGAATSAHRASYRCTGARSSSPTSRWTSLPSGRWRAGAPRGCRWSATGSWRTAKRAGSTAAESR